MSERVLIVDDEQTLARSIAQFLAHRGFSVETAADGEAALACLEQSSFDCVATDMRMPRCDGLELLSRMREAGCTEPVVVMSAHGSFELAVDVMKLGVQDFLRKPVDLNELEAVIRRSISAARMHRELAYLRERDAGAEQSQLPVAESESMRSICAEIGRLALVAQKLEPGDAPPLLITGETGTGKSFLARHFHHLIASDADVPFIEVNCTNLPVGLVDSELFGHERGAFTDAKSSRKGLVEAAEGGSLYLDEIGNLDVGIQGNLLSVIEDKTLRRVGGSDVRRVNVRFVASTNADLEACIDDGRFRSDLFFRLATFRIHVPPLRERREDIGPLADRFLERLSAKYGGMRQLTDPSRQALGGYDWPGNIREMRNVLERAVVLAPDGKIEPRHLAGVSGTSHVTQPGVATTFALPQEGIDWEKMESDLLDQALDRTGGNLTAAARLLGMSRSRLRYRLERHKT